MNVEEQIRKALPPSDLRLQSDEHLEAMLDEADAGDDRISRQNYPAILAEAVAGEQPVAHRTQHVWRPMELAAIAAVIVLAVVIAALQFQNRPADTIADFPVDPSEPTITGTPQDTGSGNGMKDVLVDFPKPVYIGTPEMTNRPHLDKSKTPVRTFRAPSGTKLISRDCKITSSDPEPIIGELAMVTDGDKDGTDGSFVELGPDKQWVQIDLGEKREIWAIVVWHFHKRARIYDDVVIQISSDPAFKSDVVTLLNNDHDNSSGFGVGKDLAWIETNHGRIIRGGGKKARFVRLYSNGNTANELNHYTEVEVHGR